MPFLISLANTVSRSHPEPPNWSSVKEEEQVNIRWAQNLSFLPPLDASSQATPGRSTLLHCQLSPGAFISSQASISTQMALSLDLSPCSRLPSRSWKPYGPPGKTCFSLPEMGLPCVSSWGPPSTLKAADTSSHEKPGWWLLFVSRP